MKVQHFFKMGLGLFLLALLVACGQAPLIKPETGQPAPVEAVVPQTDEQPVTSETEATTGSVPIDPADRKFFNPDYGAIPGGSKEVEALPNIDPADRKFFSPGYGAQPVNRGEADPLSRIDPADRKFFSPGYGVISGRSKEAEVLPTTGAEPQTLAWPPRPTQFRPTPGANSLKGVLFQASPMD